MTALPTSTQSFWINSTAETRYSQASQATVDVAIIDGGIMGITAAKKPKRLFENSAKRQTGYFNRR